MAGGNGAEQNSAPAEVVMPAPQGVEMVTYLGVVMPAPMMEAMLEQERKAQG